MKIEFDWLKFDPGPASQKCKAQNEVLGRACCVTKTVAQQPYPTKREKLCDPK